MLAVVVVALYLAGIPATYWLTGHALVFEMVCVEDRGRMSVVWPMTWLAAGCAGLLIGTAMVHERLVGREPR